MAKVHNENHARKNGVFSDDSVSRLRRVPSFRNHFRQKKVYLLERIYTGTTELLQGASMGYLLSLSL